MFGKARVISIEFMHFCSLRSIIYMIAVFRIEMTLDIFLFTGDGTLLGAQIIYMLWLGGILPLIQTAALTGCVCTACGLA